MNIDIDDNPYDPDAIKCTGLSVCAVHGSSMLLEIDGTTRCFQMWVECFGYDFKTLLRLHKRRHGDVLRGSRFE